MLPHAMSLKLLPHTLHSSANIVTNESLMLHSTAAHNASELLPSTRHRYTNIIANERLSIADTYWTRLMSSVYIPDLDLPFARTDFPSLHNNFKHLQKHTDINLSLILRP